ncbi:Gonadotropin-releasing hormone II receptor [Halotydeus destructor]|nr:Gonadotropin-releasing hormone II receptor [Halotydeus destructor]
MNDAILSNFTMLSQFSNLTNDELQLLNESFHQWLHYSRFNGSCITDLLPANFQVFKYYFIAAYVVLLIVGAVENLSALKELLSDQRRRNIVNTVLLINLTMANMIVTFAIIPIEIAWRISLSWPTGQVGCKVLQFVRALGPYLSSMILIGISLDRYLVLTRPFSRNGHWRRGVVSSAWFFAIVFSLPQSFIFHLERHPICSGFIQCVSLYFFESEASHKMYNLVSLTILYVIPLVVIIYCYAFIIMTIRRHTEELQRFSNQPRQTSIKLIDFDQRSRSTETASLSQQAVCELNQHSRLCHITKSRLRDKRYRTTVKKTLIIIVAFIVCWTPFVLLIFIGQVYPDFSRKLNPYLKDAMLMFAVSNSCVNPLVYGTHNSLFKKLFLKAWTRIR